MSRTDRLLINVKRRQRANLILLWFGRFAVGLALIYAGLLLITRLLSLTPIEFDPWMAAIVPGIALLLAVVTASPAGGGAAARAVDHTAGTKDLFLTTTKLDGAPG